MALKSHIDADTHAALPSDVQSEYSQEGDGFVLQVEGVNGYALDNVAEIKSALDNERGLTKEMKQKLKGMEGLDPDAARAALAKVEEMKDWKPDDKVAEIIAQKTNALTEKFDTDLKTERERSEGLYGQLTTALVDGTGSAAIAKKGGNVAVLLPHLKAATKLVENEGKFEVRFVDAKGNELLTKKPNSTDYMGADEYVEKIMMKDENFMPNFEGLGAAGFGSRTSDKGGGGQQKGGELVISEKDSRDVALYRAARAEATKLGKRLVIRG